MEAHASLAVLRVRTGGSRTAVPSPGEPRASLGEDSTTSWMLAIGLLPGVVTSGDKEGGKKEPKASTEVTCPS